MIYKPQVLRCIIFACAGAGIGSLIDTGGGAPQRAALGILGGLIGAMLGLPGVSIGRTLKLTVTLIIARNASFLAEPMYKWVDSDAADNASSTADRSLSDRFQAWIMAVDVAARRGWWVAGGMIVGAVSGILIWARDVNALPGQGGGLLLPVEWVAAKKWDEFVIHLLVVVFAFSTWGGALMGLVASPAYRRPLIVGITFAAFLSACIGFAAAAKHPERIWNGIGVFSTIGAFFALVVGGLGGADDDDAAE